MTVVSRHILAKKLGRRISLGEYERKTTEYNSRITFVSAVSRKARTGEPRIIRELAKSCPKYRRKHG